MNTAQWIALISALTALVTAIAALLHSLGVGKMLQKHLAKHKTGQRTMRLVRPAATTPPSASWLPASKPAPGTLLPPLDE